MRNAFVLSFLILAGLCSAASAGDPAEEALEGAWVVQVGDQSRDRFLIVTGAKREQNRVVPTTAIFGWIDTKGREISGWQAEVFGDTINLSFHTPADSLIKVSFKADETSVAGDMVTKAGRKYDVRMTRLAAEELQALRQASVEAKKAQQPAAMKVAKDAKIYLVYVGADDCTPCRRFEAKYRNADNLKEIAPELAEARYVKAGLWSYKDAVPAASLPDELKWLVQPDTAGKLPLRKRGTPFFAAVVDHRVLAQGHGTTALETLVAPAIKRVVDARRAAN